MSKIIPPPVIINKPLQIINRPLNSEFSDFFSPIHDTKLTQLPLNNPPKNNSQKIIPEIIQKKKTLILDLDETLVHSSMQPFKKGADITLHLNFHGRNIFIYVLKRPFLDIFLEEMSKIYEIIIFTASLADYSEPLLNIIDKKQYIKYRLNRTHCLHYQNIYIKDLKVINRDLKDMIIVDNNPESYLLNKENALPILTWEEDPNDRELEKLIPILKFLAKENDVRNVINKIVDRKNEIINFNEFNKLINDSKIINNNKSNINNNNIISNNNIITYNNIISDNNINQAENENININHNVIANNNINKINNNNIIINNNIAKIDNNISTPDKRINNNINNFPINNSKNYQSNTNKTEKTDNINYNINKRIYIKKEILGPKRRSSPYNNNNNISLRKNINKENNYINNNINNAIKNNINNNIHKEYINTELNNKKVRPIFSDYQKNLYPKDNDRSIRTNNLRLQNDNKLFNQYSDNLNVNNNNINNIKKYTSNTNNLNNKINTTNPINQINVSNSTINIYNNKPEINILLNNNSNNSKQKNLNTNNQIKFIKKEDLTPIRTVKNKRIFSPNKRENIITPIKNDYNNYILTNPNYEKTYNGKTTKTVSVRKLFYETTNKSFDNNNFIQTNPNAFQKLKNIKIDNNINNLNNNGFHYNQSMANFFKNNNVKNNNVKNVNIKNNKVIKIDNANNIQLRNQRSMNDLNRTTKIKNIEVVKSKKNIKFPDNKCKKINVKVKEKESEDKIVFNNIKNKQKNKLMDKRPFSREKFLKENFGIII